MFACSRFLVRSAAPVTLVRELNNGLRGGGSSMLVRQNSLSTSAAILVAAATKDSSSSTSTQQPPAEAPLEKKVNKVDVTCCGFSKKMLGGSSIVLECNVFGEDACFIANFKSTHVAGVADGVGGWRNYKIDPSVFSSRLMKHCAEIVKEGEFEPSRPDLIIAKAYELLQASPRPAGSSTACVIIVHQKTLYSANLGDSGYLVCRQGRIIHRSKEQTHYFNAPFQLSLIPENLAMEGVLSDTPEKSDLHKMKLESGDVILLATDGLWDNVPENVIVEALADVEPQTLQGACNSLALIARRLSLDQNHASPFALKAEQHGIQTWGGKPDDITIVLFYVS